MITLCRPIQSVIILVIKQIGLPLRGRLILLITRMIRDRIGLHTVLLPLLIFCIQILAPNHVGVMISALSCLRSAKAVIVPWVLS